MLEGGTSCTRVVFFCGNISLVGGTARVATVVASELASRGYQVSILSMSGGERSAFPIAPGVQLHSLHMESRSANFSDHLRWQRLRDFVKNRRIDVLIDVDTVLSWYSIPATRGLHTRVVSWEHFHLGVNVGGFGQRWRRWMARQLASRAAACVVTLTERDREQYLAGINCSRPIVAIPNPVTLPRGVEGSRARENVVLAVGRLVPQKGFDLLISAWARVEADGWKIRIVGSGESEKKLKDLAASLGVSESVEFVGQSDNVAFHYHQASIYALSSRFEGMGLVLIEAKAHGLPIVSFDCACGPSDVVRDGVDGVLVADGDVVALANAIQTLIKDPHRRHAYAQAALEDQRFSVDAIVDQWMALIASQHVSDVGVVAASDSPGADS